MRREGLEHGEKGCWKGPSLQALACSAAFGVDSKNSVCVREKNSRHGACGGTCSARALQRFQTVEISKIFPAAAGAVGRGGGNSQGLRPASRRARNFFRGSAHRPRKRGGSRSSSVETGGVRREGRRRTRAQPRTREGRNGAQGVEAASAARASFRRFIRLRMRSRLRLEIRST